MGKLYEIVDIKEKELEEFIKKHPEHIEEGLRFIDQQVRTDRGPLDLLMVDSGGALVIAELKVVKSDSMIFQAVDYYDYVANNIDSFARAYKDYDIDVKQRPRLLLIAPSFSPRLLNRCRWIDIPISLFTFVCIKVSDCNKIIPIFKEIDIPPRPEVMDSYSLEDRYNYVKDLKVREELKNFIKEIANWDSDKNISITPTKYDISVKAFGKVIAYICPRRSHFTVYVPNQGSWLTYQVPNSREEALQAIKEKYISLNPSIKIND